ncbi:NAD(P)-dependent oxidoreductase [Nocardiopsis dassonvillei]
MHQPCELSSVIVLGGTGWVGRHVCAALRAQGSRVLAVGRHSPAGPADTAFQRLDLSTASVDTLRDLFESHRADAVVNATDVLNATDGWEHTDEVLWHGNVTVVERIVAAVEAARPISLVHLGTVHEYGPIPRGRLQREDTDPAPVGTYARTRLAGSDTVLRAARAGRITGTVLRLVNVCGPHPSPMTFPGKLLRVFDEAARVRAAGGAHRPTIRVARARRDLVDVRDTASAVLSAASGAASGEAVNIGTGRATSMVHLVRSLARISGLGGDGVLLETAPPGELGASWLAVDPAKARALLGWTPAFGVERSLRDMWNSRGDPTT